MRYLLIDTNCWAKDLLASDSDNYLLETLEYWVKNEEVVLLVPEIIKLIEWPKTRELYIEDFRKNSEKLLDAVEKSMSPLPTLISLQINNYKNKAARITNLVDLGVCYSASQDVKAEMADRQLKHEAPFHNKQRSLADGLIYFSTIEYAEQRKIEELYFITRNSSDFQKSKDNTELHDALQHPTITVQFYPQLGHAIHDLKKELPSLTKATSFETNKDYISQFMIYEKEIPASIVDQLTQALDRYYNQLPFIPTHILARIAPFKILKEKRGYVYNSSFALHTNNEELINLLESVSIEENKISISDPYLSATADAEKKVYSALRKLNDNLIFDIYCQDNNKEKDIRLKENRVCHCVRCTYNRLEFSRSLSEVHEINDHPTEKIKQAFIHYKFGNFSQSLKSFYSLYEYANTNNKPLFGFICLYNLKRLQHYIKGHFRKTDESVEKIFQVLESTSLDRYILAHSSEPAFVRENMKWIDETSFYNEAHTNITNVVEKISEHYDSQLAGGWSSNSHLAILISSFAEIDIFLENNCIIYSDYSEFVNLFNWYLRGLFMSHAFSERQDSRLDYFDDYLLLKIITHGQADKIIKLFNKYHLSSLRYKASLNGDKTIDKTILYLFEDYDQLVDQGVEQIEQKGFHFWNNYRKVLGNTFVVLALADLPEESIEPIAAAILPLLEKEKFIHKTQHRYLARFISRKGKFFSPQTIQKLLHLCIDKNWLHSQEIFNALKYQILRYHNQLVITDASLYERIVTSFFNECEKCKTFHHGDILIEVYFILSDRLKGDLTKKIEEHLQNNFNADTYYLFAVYDVIDYRKFFHQFRQLILVPKEKVTNKHPWYGHGEVALQNLNQLINLCYKNNVDLGIEEFQKYKGITDYYDWLLDMQNFDYSRFNPEWVLEYQTDFYIKKIFSCSPAVKSIKYYLKKTQNPRISELYIENIIVTE
jgi:hypothetical protein